MDFEDSPEEAAFRTEVRKWLDANAKLRSKRDEASDDMENLGFLREPATRDARPEPTLLFGIRDRKLQRNCRRPGWTACLSAGSHSSGPGRNME